ncbi:transketolase [Stygiobacter electus]|uniref:Transketolase n=1 Tax=Stygiobacter electus TaxID=3032292 RepID=A0AAE3P4X6_9BACT|nr:transketolase [Stygiobacter electus]MDF1613090.1 transketolase [Stygiobacter electus]
MSKKNSEEFAKKIRLKTIEMVYKAKASHVGGALSMVDILAALYSGILKYNPRKPKWNERDRFLLSKGHACTSLYATLALSGFFDVAELDNYAKDGSIFLSHASHKIQGVELSTGSLGHALPVGCGLALAAKRKNEKHRIFILLSDGELDEGSNWEAILFAPKHNLDNLTIIIDYNKIQSLGNVKDVLDLEPLSGKLKAFNWQTIEIDGHNHEQIFNALSTLPKQKGIPTAIIAHTIKGKGVDFMESKLLWHYKSPNDEDFRNAIKQIE